MQFDEDKDYDNDPDKNPGILVVLSRRLLRLVLSVFIAYFGARLADRIFGESSAVVCGRSFLLLLSLVV